MISEGKKADLVLLSANPLIDIRNIEEIETVFSGRVYLTKDNKQRLLGAVATANEKSRNLDISTWTSD